MAYPATDPVFARPPVYNSVGALLQAGHAGIPARLGLAAVITAGILSPGRAYTSPEESSIVEQALRMADLLLAA